MATDVTQQGPAAILSADGVGHSRLMALNEDATARTLSAFRDENALRVGEHHGRVVDAPGDHLLAAFRGPIDAVP